MAKNKNLFKTEEVAFRWNKETEEYKTVEIAVDAAGDVYIFCRAGTKGDEESKIAINVCLNDAEFAKLKMIVDKIWKEKMEGLFE